MVKWKLKLNFLQRMHPLCVCWLRWRMSTQSLWRLQVRWTEIFFPLSFPIASFLSQPAYPEKCQGHKGKDCSAEKLESRKSWTCILSYGTFDEKLRETAACGLCFPLSSSRVAGWKHLAGSSENKLQFVKHFELSCVLWPLPLLALAGHQERREVPVNNYMTIMACV